MKNVWKIKDGEEYTLEFLIEDYFTHMNSHFQMFIERQQEIENSKCNMQSENCEMRIHQSEGNVPHRGSPKTHPLISSVSPYPLLRFSGRWGWGDAERAGGCVLHTSERMGIDWQSRAK